MQGIVKVMWLTFFQLVEEAAVGFNMKKNKDWWMIHLKIKTSGSLTAKTAKWLTYYNNCPCTPETGHLI